MSGDVCETCGHDWDRHGPEAGGCVECPCWLVGDGSTARPAAGDTRTDRERVRHAVARWLYHQTGRNEDDLPALADDLLALPELSGLLDAAERDAATVRRVEAAIDRHADNLSPTQRAAFRRALDGQP